MKKKTLRVISSLCAVAFLIAALSVSALAGNSIEEQMAANSAAWYIAYNAGDMATCDALHEENVRLAALLAGENGQATYNDNSGTWDIVTDSGDHISHSEEHNGKNEVVTYTTTSGNGRLSGLTTKTYSDDSINSYMAAGGTNSGLANSYNNAAEYVSVNDDYTNYGASDSAASEAAVAKALLGLSDAEAANLQAQLEALKQTYESAQAAYEAAMASGNTSAAAAAAAQMDMAHAAAQELRSYYNYSGDSSSYNDGEYFYGYGSGSSTTKATYTITASASTGGAISPSGSVSVTEGNSVTFTMSAKSGYRMVRFEVDGVSMGTGSSYTFSNVQGNHTIRAVFTVKSSGSSSSGTSSSYTIQSSAGTGGKISPSGTKIVSYGGSKTYTITPNTGYHISQVLVDGTSVGAVSSYTFSNVKAAHTISATFAKDTFTITASAGTGGSITPSGNQSVSYGGSKTYTITPNTGYHISQVLVDGTSVGVVSNYTFSNVKAEHTISATFAKDTYTITASAGTGGSINPSGNQSVSYGGSKTYTITPNTGYHISQVLVDGTIVGAVSSFTFNNVKAAHTISATFAKDTYTITASSGTGGSITPSGSQSVSYGASKTYTITPNTGYHISQVLVDGTSVDSVTSYTFNNVKAEHTISATFAKNAFTITASAGVGGYISSQGMSSVLYGENKGFTIIPADGFEIENVVVDGVSIGAISNYTFRNVTAAHTISATFSAAGRISVGTLTVMDSTGVSLNGRSIKSGYGFMVRVPVTVIAVTDVQVVLTYDFGGGLCSVRLVQDGGYYVLPPNSASPTGSRVVYIPVATADDTYTIQVVMTAKNSQGQTLVNTATGVITVRGSMYEDDFTGDS